MCVKGVFCGPSGVTGATGASSNWILNSGSYYYLDCFGNTANPPFLTTDHRPNLQVGVAVTFDGSSLTSCLYVAPVGGDVEGIVSYQQVTINDDLIVGGDAFISGELAIDNITPLTGNELNFNNVILQKIVNTGAASETNFYFQALTDPNGTSFAPEVAVAVPIDGPAPGITGTTEVIRLNNLLDDIDLGNTGSFAMYDFDVDFKLIEDNSSNSQPGSYKFRVTTVADVNNMVPPTFTQVFITDLAATDISGDTVSYSLITGILTILYSQSTSTGGMRLINGKVRVTGSG